MGAPISTTSKIGNLMYLFQTFFRTKWPKKGWKGPKNYILATLEITPILQFFLEFFESEWKPSILRKIKWQYLHLHTTRALDFWYRNIYSRYILPYQKSSAWVVCRWRYGQFIFLRIVGFHRGPIFWRPLYPRRDKTCHWMSDHGEFNCFQICDQLFQIDVGDLIFQLQPPHLIEFVFRVVHVKEPRREYSQPAFRGNTGEEWMIVTVVEGR